MNGTNITAVMDFIFWWTSSSGDERTQNAVPANLRSLLEDFEYQAGRIGFSKVEILMMFTEILMSELVSNVESFDNINEWFTALGEYWAAETSRWRAEITRRLAAANPTIAVSIMVYTGGRPREQTPRSAAAFAQMVAEDRIEIFRNQTTQQANRL